MCVCVRMKTQWHTGHARMTVSWLQRPQKMYDTGVNHVDAHVDTHVQIRKSTSTKIISHARLARSTATPIMTYSTPTHTCYILEILYPTIAFPFSDKDFNAADCGSLPGPRPCSPATGSNEFPAPHMESPQATRIHARCCKTSVNAGSQRL